MPNALPELLFSSVGRIGRARFVLAILGLIALFMAYGVYLGARAPGVVGVLVDMALLFCAACLLCKRLHDRGRAGWWAGLALIAWAMIWPQPHGLIAWLFAPVLVWAVVDLGLLPGQASANRFGPPAKA